MGKRKWTILWILVPILVVVAFILLSINFLLDPDLYRNVLQKSLTTSLDREVSIGKAKITVWGGVGIAFEDFRIKDRSLTFDLLQSKRLILRLRVLPLLKREIKCKRIVIERPTLYLIRDKTGQFNIFSGGPLTNEKLKQTQKKILETLTSLFGGSLTLRGGEILFSDESLGSSRLKTEIRSFNFQLSKVSYHEAFPFQISGMIGHSKKEGEFSIHGTIRDIPEDLDFSKGRVEAEVKIKGIQTLHFWPYLKMLLPMKTISGVLDVNAHYQGTFQGSFKTSASIKIKELLFDYPEVFSFVLKPKWVNIDFGASYDSKNLEIPRFLIELPELSIKAKGRIYGIGSKEMGMEAEASSSPFDVAEGKKFIPFQVITPDVSDHLFRAEGKGSFQILSVRLSGKMPEIDHCDLPANAHVLSIEGKLDGASLKPPWNIPSFEDLRGRLFFQKGHLHFEEVTGRFFHSTLENAKGAFYDLLQVATLQIDCQGKLDLMDLPSLSKTEGMPEEFSRALSSIHILSGKAQYSLSARGLLKPPIRFQHHETYHLSRIRFTHEEIPFPIRIGEGRVELSQKDLEWSEAKVEFGHSSLTMSGLWTHGEKEGPLEFMAKGRMDLKNLFALCRTPLFPEEVRSKTDSFEAISGTTQIAFKGKTASGTPHFSYEGEFFPKEASLLQKQNPLPLVIKEGGVSFSNAGIGFSKTKIQTTSSALTLDGWIGDGNVNLSTWGAIDLKQLFSLMRSSLSPDPVRKQVEGIEELNGRAEVRLKWVGKTEKWIDALNEGEVRVREVNLRHREIPVPLSLTEGHFLATPEQIRFDRLNGRVGDSPITFSGSLSRGSPSSPTASPTVEKSSASTESVRRLSFQMTSPQLDLDPLFPKREGSSPTSFEKLKDWLSNWSVDGKVEIEKGKYRGFHYENLKGEMKTVDGTFFIRPFQFKADGGDFWGEGWIRPTERGLRFEIKPRISNMESKAFIRTLFGKGEEERVIITGRVHVDKVALSGEGENFQKIRESLNGSLRFEIEKGMIERWKTLSRIFSILNVSQLFMGRLPDLKTKGLPYHNMMATLQIKDGIASTEDFLVDSDAMKITLRGKIDLGKNFIDARIGVHPLVTIDKILGNVPVAGYILTGKDKGFISFFYDVNGNLDDPKIEAIPLKSIEEPTWGIIKRLLLTPLRPFRSSSSSDKEKK
ncbi:MAG: YhdP family protein [Thermodesulfobacteriota bacterium]